MSTEIKFKKDRKGVVESVTVKNAVFYYTNIRTPRPIFDDRDLPYEKARKEYSVDVAVTEEVADAWDEVFTKQPSKKYSNAKFMEKYKLEDESELPFPKEKKQFTIKFTQKVEKKDGTLISDGLIPRVLISTDEGKVQDITFDTNVGNGSKGNVLLRAVTNGYGTFSYLSKVKVEDLVEYEGGGLSEEEKEFLGVDEVEYAEAPGRSGAAATPAREEEEAAQSTTPSPTTEVDEDEF